MRYSRTQYVLAVSLLASISSFAQLRVEGTVVDSKGRLSATASVLAWPIVAGGYAGDSSPARTDQEGRFQLRLYPGRYELRAEDAAGLYPNPSFVLGHDPSVKFTTISVRKSNLHGIVVKLGRKGFLLKGDVRAPDGTPIPHSTVTITDPKDARGKVIVTVGKDGTFEFVSPAKPLLITATADGFTESAYNKGKPVTSVVGQAMNIHIQLFKKAAR